MGYLTHDDVVIEVAINTKSSRWDNTNAAVETVRKHQQWLQNWKYLKERSRTQRSLVYKKDIKQKRFILNIKNERVLK